jgi:hypothetical protein
MLIKTNSCDATLCYLQGLKVVLVPKFGFNTEIWVGDSGSSPLWLEFVGFGRTQQSLR